MYDIKALYEAESVDDAIRLLQEHPEAQIIAGGSDVLVQMREGKRAGKELVSIYKIDALRGVSLDEDRTIRIGSLTSFSHITKNPIIQKYINVLGEAVDMVGGPQIRNIGTIGGNTCNGVTSADSASTLFAWDAVIEIAGPDGIRRVPIQDFYIKAGVVDLHPGELQTAILIPKASYEGYKGHYIKYAMRNAMDIATTGCSVNVKLSPDNKTIIDARIAYGVAGPIPMRAPSAEAIIKGKPVCENTCEEFAEAVLQDINPRTSWRATKEFRVHIAKVLANRALNKAIELCMQSPDEAIPDKADFIKQAASCEKAANQSSKDSVLKASDSTKQYSLVRCTINGKPVEAMVDVRASLTDMLRNDYRLTSVKKGCEVGECGACNVIINGECYNSCIYLAIWADGKEIRTLEGLLGPNGELSDIQQAFVDEAAIQCGFCTPGFIMTAVEILESGRDYTDDELRKLLSGHLCRCTGYENILRAVKKTLAARLNK